MFRTLLATLILLVAFPAAAEPPCRALSDEALDSYNDALGKAVSAADTGDLMTAIEQLKLARDVCDEDPILDLRLAQWFLSLGDCKQSLVWYDRVNAHTYTKELDELQKRARSEAVAEMRMAEERCSKSRVRLTCEDDNVSVKLGDDGPWDCPAETTVAPGRYEVSATAPGRSLRITVQLVAGETSVVVIPSLPQTQQVDEVEDVTPFSVGVLFVPGVGWANGGIAERYTNNDVETGAGSIELDGLSNSQFYYGVALRFGYEFDEMWGIGAEARLQLARQLPIGGLVAHARFVDTRWFDMLATVLVEFGQLYQIVDVNVPISADQSQRQSFLTSAGPVVAGLSLDMVLNIVPTFGLQLGIEFLSAFPDDLALHLASTVGVTFRF